jgi:hypothetical protein
MRSALSILLATGILVAAVAARPTPGIAQVPDPAATATPVPAVASPVPQETPGEASAPVEAGATPQPAEDAAPESDLRDEVVVREEREDDTTRSMGSPGARNIVYVMNRSDGKMRIRGRIRLVQSHGERAEPVNAAFAYASCTDCQTFAVALEVALISPNASVIAPQNRAQAINYECTRCATVARAMQYAYVVDDPSAVPDNVRRLLRDMEAEIREIGRQPDITANEANARISAVIAQFQELNANLRDELAESDEITSPGAPSPSEAAPPMDPPAPAPSPAAVSP